MQKKTPASYDVRERKCCTDYRGRTPLQLAAELGVHVHNIQWQALLFWDGGTRFILHTDRTEVTKRLLTIEPKPARIDVTDNSGHPALANILRNMPQIVSYWRCVHVRVSMHACTRMCTVMVLMFIFLPFPKSYCLLNYSLMGSLELYCSNCA